MPLPDRCDASRSSSNGRMSAAPKGDAQPVPGAVSGGAGAAIAVSLGSSTLEWIAVEAVLTRQGADGPYKGWRGWEASPWLEELPSMRSFTRTVSPALHAMCIRCATVDRHRSKAMHANVCIHCDAPDELTNRLAWPRGVQTKREWSVALATHTADNVCSTARELGQRSHLQQRLAGEAPVVSSSWLLQEASWAKEL